MSVQRTPSDRTVSLPTSPTRYDLVLLLLPVPLLCGAFASAVTNLSVTLGVGAGSLPSLLLFCYAISVAAPTKKVTERSA